MRWDAIYGQDVTKKRLMSSLEKGRIAHAQLFIGKNGYGSLALALAYARAVICGEDEKANKLMDSYQHPDLFFSYPIATNKEKKIEKSSDLISFWRQFLNQGIYSDLYHWMNLLGQENKQLIIGTEDAREIVNHFKLKSFSGGYRVQIIWMADRMNASASNKLLKMIEEPPEKSLILLIAEEDQNILGTIRSRCQTVNIPPYSNKEIEDYVLEHLGMDAKQARSIALRADGDLGKAIDIVQGEGDHNMEALFIEWVRNAFQAKTKPAVLKNLHHWAGDLGSWSRDRQIEFLLYSSRLFRLALLQNYASVKEVYRPIQDEDFKWEAFCNYVHGGNIEKIMQALDRAIYEIGRNVNAKSVLLDTSIQITRFIHVAP